MRKPIVLAAVAAAPSEAESRLAKKYSRQLDRIVRARRNQTVRARFETGGRSCELVQLPASAVRMLVDILSEMGRGRAVSVRKVADAEGSTMRFELNRLDSELTTQEAADMLNVSRPFVIKQIEAGALPCRKVGRHRRVRLSDVMDFKRSMDEGRLKALEKLSEIDQDLGLGY